MRRFRKKAIIVVALAFASSGFTQSSSNAPAKESRVTTHARGTFEIQMTPQPFDDKADEGLGRFIGMKQIHGDLEGTSKVHMLTAGDPKKGSAGYVAMEKVTGTPNGRSGSFILQHSATMTRGAQHLVITVVPDSGTDQLTGLSGTFTIIIADGKHSYDFEYTLPKAP